MTARRAVVAVSVSLALTSGCGGSQEISAEDTVRAEQLLSQTDGSLEGEWSRFGDLLTAWAIQEDEDGEYDASTGSYRLASCVAVNLEHRIDNEEDRFSPRAPWRTSTASAQSLRSQSLRSRRDLRRTGKRR